MGYVQNRTNLLPPTGQTTSYRDGDDGYFQTGNPRDRFIDNGDGTITDRHTGLMWVKASWLMIPGATGVHPTNQIQSDEGNWANSTGYAPADVVTDTSNSTYWICLVEHTSAGAGTFADDRTANPTYWRQTIWREIYKGNIRVPRCSWNDAIDRCLALEYAGYDDWRLANVKEAVSITDFKLGWFPAIFSEGILDSPVSLYSWTSTTQHNRTDYAIYVEPAQADASPDLKTFDASRCPGFIVRGGHTV